MLKVEYQGEDGFQIVKISDHEYYYGDGETINSKGISANQFLRFHPYIEYIGNKEIKPTKKIEEFLENVKEKNRE